MNRKLLMLLVLFFATTLLTACGKEAPITDSQVQVEPVVTKEKTADFGPMSSIATVADKVQVFLFHSTKRCSTCIAIGKLTGETVNERFPDELKSGKIEFREVNIDLPENKDLAMKFQASGSSLFINAIKGDQDSIVQDTKVWRLTGDPTAFKNYLEGQINILLGK